MKTILTFLALIFYTNLFAQTNLDSLLGVKGIFSTLVAKDIMPNTTLTFNIKLTIVSTAIGGSNKQHSNIVYLNTTNGYIGMDKVAAPTLHARNTEIDFLVETITKQSLWYTQNKMESKTVKKLSTNLITTYQNLPLKKADALLATAKKYLNNTLTAEPYFLDVTELQKKVVRYIYPTNLPTNAVFKSYMGNYGVGFYHISNSTYVCLATQNKVMKTEITKIEKVNILFDTAGFKEKN